MSQELFKIEGGIPMPSKSDAKNKYPFRRLKVGESFLVPCLPNERQGVMYSLTSCMRWATYKSGFKFAQRAGLHGVRVWRTQ